MPDEPSEALLLRQVSDVIHTLRGQRFMLDTDLATPYGVEAKHQAMADDVTRPTPVPAPDKAPKRRIGFHR